MPTDTTERGPECLIYITLVGSSYDSISKRGTVGVLCNGVRQGRTPAIFFSACPPSANRVAE